MRSWPRSRPDQGQTARTEFSVPPRTSVKRALSKCADRSRRPRRCRYGDRGRTQRRAVLEFPAVRSTAAVVALQEDRPGFAGHDVVMSAGQVACDPLQHRSRPSLDLITLCSRRKYRAASGCIKCGTQPHSRAQCTCRATIASDMDAIAQYERGIENHVQSMRGIPHPIAPSGRHPPSNADRAITKMSRRVTFMDKTRPRAY